MHSFSFIAIVLLAIIVAAVESVGTNSPSSVSATVPVVVSNTSAASSDSSDSVANDDPKAGSEIATRVPVNDSGTTIPPPLVHEQSSSASTGNPGTNLSNAIGNVTATSSNGTKGSSSAMSDKKGGKKSGASVVNAAGLAVFSVVALLLQGAF